MRKIFKLLLLTTMITHTKVSFGQCSAAIATIPSAPSCPWLIALGYSPISSSITKLGGNLFAGELGSVAGNYAVIEDVTTSLDINTGAKGLGSTVDIYVCSGITFTLTGVNIQTGPVRIFVLSGGTFIPPSNYQGGSATNTLSTYVYGTMKLSSSLNVQNNSSIYISTVGALFGGLPVSSGITMTGSSGSIYNEGTLDVYDLNLQNGTFCVNNGGCAIVRNSLDIYSRTTPIGTSGTGYVYNNTLSAPKNASNKVTSNVGGAQVCTKEASPSSNWGTSSVNANSTCYATSCNSPLFFSRLSFHVEKAADGVFVSWKTTPSKETESFLVQKSKNGYDWEELGYTLYNPSNNYSLPDPSPYLVSGTYYRLLETKRNSTPEIIAIDYIDNTRLGSYFYVSPYQNGIQLNINGNEEVYSAQFFDMKGSLLGTYEIKNGQNTIENTFMPGTYIVKIFSTTEFKSKKIIIQ